jgi:Family of unknown function (DUF6308)
MERFVDDDAGYLAWLASHPHGYVLNAYPHVTSEYLVLHRAACRTVNRPLAVGRHWTHLYGKACSDDCLQLESWAQQRTGKSVQPCGSCLPGELANQASGPRKIIPNGRKPGPRAPHSAGSAIEFVGAPIQIVVTRGSSSVAEAAPSLVIEGAQWLAETFFRCDPSAVGGLSYDAWIQATQADLKRRDRIIDGDVTAVNRTMAARTSHATWAPIVEGEGADLIAALDPDWDLFEMDPESWAGANVAAHLEQALNFLHRPGLGIAVITKVLHVKRPKLIPVLDSLVLEVIGASVTASVSTWVEAIEDVRGVGRSNLLELRAIREHLDSVGIHSRTLVRVLDALLWTGSPGSNLFPSLSGWELVLRPVAVR